MEALLVDDIPRDEGWQYEPKWDGFRCLVFKDGPEVLLQSKSGQPLGRYFPELVDIFAGLPVKQLVLDGEIVIPVAGRLSFDDLLMRIHPAASRVKKLAAETPALLVCFDLLVTPRGESLVDRPLRDRRPKLEQLFQDYLENQPRIQLSPAATEYRQAEKWFKTAGGDLDGVIAKQLDCPYKSGERTGMEKIKPVRTADCVVGGFRYASKGHVVGSLLLGLYDDDGLLHHVGFCSGLKSDERKALLAKLEPLVKPPGFTGHAPGGPSRWSTERSGEWVPLDPKLVVEVSYDHFTGGRFRHGTGLIRWRPDKAPRQCRMEQVARSGRGSLTLLAA
jgi:ATP-dependent DNA ligase